MKNILITGTSSGIGYAIAKKLAASGFEVYAGVRKKDDFDKLDKIDNITAVMLDIENEDDLERVGKLFEDKRLDVLINNAGIGVPGAMIEISKKDLEKQFNVNVFSTLMMIQAVRDSLIRDKSHIITISSINGHLTTPFGGAYTMSKFALESMHEALRAELKAFGIKVSIINPGQYRTDIFDKLKEAYISISKNSKYYSEVFDKLKNFNSQVGRDTEFIAEDVLSVINSEKPPFRLISAADHEKEWAYNAIIKRLRDLLANSSGITLEEYIK